jgi:cation diffusion facilitator family transporter
MQGNKRYQIAKKAVFLSAGANLLLAIIKIVFGWLGNSQALFASGVDSFSDLFFDFLAIVAAKIGGHAPDQEHPYGHGRIETIITITLTILLLVAALGIVLNAWYSIWHARFVKPSIYVLLVALVSVLTNEGLFRYISQIGKNINSNLLNISAWHHRGDAFSSIVVLLGAGGAILGFHYLDAIAAIIVALIIMKMAVQMAWHSIRELIDTAVDPATLQQITDIITQIHGVHAVHQLRTRLLGGLIFVEVHILVDERFSVSEGHFIANQVMKKIQQDIPKIIDVLVHVDIEDDEQTTSGLDLPGREELLPRLKQHWDGLLGCNEIKQINLHYLRNKIEIEILLPLAILQKISDLEDLKQQYQAAVRDLNYITSVKILLL